jgi:hypothetical protein
MFTYLIIDPKSKTHYVGSSTNTKRPLRHLKGKSCNNRLANITGKRDVFVFISEDDGLETRDEEQFYLDFYFGSKWCMNASNTAAGGDGHGAFARYNKSEKRKQDQKGSGAAKRKTWREKSDPRRPFKDPEAHRENISLSHVERKKNDPLYAEKMRRSQRSSVLSRWGFEGVYPEVVEHRLALSSDFVHYYSYFGKWSQ